MFTRRARPHHQQETVTGRAQASREFPVATPSQLSPSAEVVRLWHRDRDPAVTRRKGTIVEDECIHLLDPETCTICNGKDRPSASGGRRTGGAPERLDSPASVETYRERYGPEREQTFEAYVEVFFRLTGARDFPGGWMMFSRCANAEPALVRDEPKLVARAEELMRNAGYVADDSGRPGKGRIWHRTDRGVQRTP